MKKWVLFIIKINPRLAGYCKSDQRYIEGIAQSFAGNAVWGYDEILRIIDKKIRHINLKVLFDCFRECVDTTEWTPLVMYARGKTLDVLAKELNTSRATVFRRLKKAIEKCRSELLRLGFCEERLNEDYGIMYANLQKEKSRRKAAAQKDSLEQNDSSFEPCKLNADNARNKWERSSLLQQITPSPFVC